jgi:FAD dependent oxidoreductase
MGSDGSGPAARVDHTPRLNSLKRMRTGELGYWWRSLGGPPPPRPPLPGPASADVAIVGAGYTGLWAAYYLKRAQPSLEIIVLEREHAGFGALGRNGGWVSGFFSGPARVYERQRRTQATGFPALQRAMFDTVEEIAAVISRHQIEADFVKGGQLTVALNHAQRRRVRQELAHSRVRGLDERDLRELTAGELETRLRIAGAVGASFSPHAARVHAATVAARPIRGRRHRAGVSWPRAASLRRRAARRAPLTECRAAFLWVWMSPRRSRSRSSRSRAHRACRRRRCRATSASRLSHRRYWCSFRAGTTATGI